MDSAEGCGNSGILLDVNTGAKREPRFKSTKTWNHVDTLPNDSFFHKQGVPFTEVRKHPPASNPAEGLGCRRLGDLLAK